MDLRIQYSSNFTVEWPFNGLGILENGGYHLQLWYIIYYKSITDSRYEEDTLYHKVKELQDHFLFLSHTYAHSCELDIASYQEVYDEFSNSITEQNELLEFP
jgi:hypothetical protein